MDFGQNNLAGVVKAASGVSRGNFWAFFFGKNNDFWMTFALWAKKFLTLPKYYGRVSETSLYVYGEEFWEKKNGKRDDFSVILYFEWKTLDFGQNNSARAIKASFRVSRRISWAFLIEKTMIFEWNLYFEQKISGLSQNFTAGFPKLQSMCPEKICERDKFWKSDDFLVILYSKFKKLDFGQKSLARVVKAAIGVSRGIFWAFFIEKTMIFEWNLYFEQKKFRTWPKLYGRVSETSIYVSAEKLWETKNWKKDDYLVILILWVKKIGLWARQLGRCCQKYIRRVWGFFIEKRMIFHIFLHFEQNHCWLLPKNYGRISKTSIYVSGENFWEKKKLTKRWILSNFVLWN